MPYDNPEQQRKANLARANHPGTKRVPRSVTTGKGVTSRAGNTVARRSPNSVANSTKSGGPRVIDIEGRVIRKPGTDVAKRSGSDVAKRGASKAGKAGRLLKVGGPIGLGAAAVYETAKYGVDKQKEKNAKGYYLTPVKNKEGQWTPSGAHAEYKKRGVQSAAKRMSERNYTTYGGKERNKGQYASAKKEWDKNKKEALANVGKGSHDLGKDLTKANQEALFNYRLNRRVRGDFKGKYYGPDEFKGNEKKLSAWRAAGSPKDKKRFA